MNPFEIIKRKPKVLTPEQAEMLRIQDFFDRIIPSTVKFFTDCFLCGNVYKSVWAIREYPSSTEEQAVLAHLADRNCVALRIYNRLVDNAEQRHLLFFLLKKEK